jgi:hypothetical protein
MDSLLNTLFTTYMFHKTGWYISLVSSMLDTVNLTQNDNDVHTQLRLTVTYLGNPSLAAGAYVFYCGHERDETMEIFLQRVYPFTVLSVHISSNLTVQTRFACRGSRQMACWSSNWIEIPCEFTNQVRLVYNCPMRLITSFWRKQDIKRRLNEKQKIQIICYRCN